MKYPSERTLVLKSQEELRIRLSEMPEGSAFSGPESLLLLSAGTPAELTFTFHPTSPGIYDQKLTLELEGSPRKIIVALHGRAVVSPETAGVTVPPPPDLIIRQYREAEIAKAIAEAKSAAAAKAASNGDDPAAGEEDGSSIEAEGSGEEAAQAEARASGGSAGQGGFAALAAFGEIASASEDQNKVPVPLPDGETKPDLPPADEDQDTGDPSQNDQGQAQKEKSPAKLHRFTVAPNSSLLLSSSEQPIPGQAFTLRVNGRSFVIGGRMRLPDVGFAFGENMTIDQWGDVQGTVAPDGSVQMHMVLRLNDPNGNVVDLPINLTTGMAVGYSSQGRVMFVNGVPRNGQGDVKLVGITNIPIGVGSSLDKAPIYMQLLGRLEL